MKCLLNCRYFIVDYRSDLFSDRPTDIAMATNFKTKSAKVIHSLPWHSKMGWNFAMAIGALAARMIWLYCVKIWWTSVQ